MSESSGAKKTVTLDGDKGIYTQDEVIDLLKSVGIAAKITKKDGKVEKAKVE